MISDLIVGQIVNVINKNHRWKSTDGPKPTSKDFLNLYKQSFEESSSDKEMFSLNIDDVKFDEVINPNGNVNLKLLYLLADNKSNKWIVGVHGYSAQKESVLFTLLTYRKWGYNILCFDLRNHGESSDEFITMGLNEVTDLQVILDYLKNKFNPSNVGLIGFSMGAHTVNTFNLLNKQDEYNIDWVISDSTYYDRKLILTKLASYFLPGGFDTSELIELVYQYYKKKYNYDIQDNSLDKLLKTAKATKPTLFICSDGDNVTDAQDSERLYKERKKIAKNDDLINLQTTNHVRGSVEKPIEYFKKVEEFLNKIGG